ncbi:Uncharacterised protein [Buttiauxella agrestis]|uniref:Putative tail fiber protein gp53-like C-terminal domain-containing protein n=1 Tax=Buttiauxella agrestis TaxID=82977 RepID=A0A381C6N1_9ENTR|nr:hypothetical protein [Buttiauxella agrestis]SUW63490.1 Uncharacterised protein [Buttiauxella agrestis]
MTSLIKVPFADSGDKTAVPETDSGGGVNMTQGYGQAYSLDPATDPSAKRIERDKMNWLFNIITKAIHEIQISGVAPFITSADNGGSPFSYGKGALISLDGVNYQSLEDANTTTPPGAKWSAVPANIQPLDATLTALAALVGGANKLPYFNGADTAALTDLTQVGRDIIGKTDIAAVLTYLGLLGGNFASGPGYSLNYLKIPVSTPSGLVTKIIQYGVASMMAGQDNVLGLPITFPNAVRTWYATGNYTANSGTLVDVNCVAGLSSITLRASAAVSAMWLVIGE